MSSDTNPTLTDTMAEWKTGRRPRLLTAALRLRPFTPDDAVAVQRLAADERIADTTMIPHPYEDGMAEKWIATHEPEFRKGRLVNFAMAIRDTDELVGMIGLVVQVGGHAAEMGYWVGVPFWGRGFTTEAGCAVLRYGFDCMGLYRIDAPHMARNPASGRVMEKMGMQHEGVLRAGIPWQGVQPPPPGQAAVEDMVMYSMLRTDSVAAALPALEFEEVQ